MKHSKEFQKLNSQKKLRRLTLELKMNNGCYNEINELNTTLLRNKIKKTFKK